ncbi:MAG: hypothetical protein ABSB97_01710 [Thermoplasmata archaeon]
MSAEVRRLQKRVRESSRVRGLLTRQFAAFREGTNRSIYDYWQGIHWVLASLADLGYPAADPQLRPLVDRATGLWLKPHYLRTFDADTKEPGVRGSGVPIIRGRARRCASQQGNALRYAAKLGFSDERSDQLTDLLLSWQWPDGGWNCDRDPGADTSSFMETLLPMQGLAAHAAATGSRRARRAAERASEVFLERRLFRKKSTGAIIARDFVELHFPLYWHYDVLGGLKGMVEVGRIADPRCSAALDWLEEKELPEGGWPAEARHYRVSSSFCHRGEYVDWGGVGRQKPNDWVSTDALYVLREAGRLRS